MSLDSSTKQSRLKWVYENLGLKWLLEKLGLTWLCGRLGLWGCFAIIAAIAGLVAFGTVLFQVGVHINIAGWFGFDLGAYPEIDGQDWAGFGAVVDGVVGSLFALAGFFALIETLLKQRKEFRTQQFEARFMEMVQLHRENVKEMTHHSPRDRKDVKGRMVFVEVIDQFCHAYTALKEYGKTNKRFKEDIERHAIPTAYLATFFGVGGMTQNSLKPRIREVLNEGTEEVIKALAEYKRVRNKEEEKAYDDASEEEKKQLDKRRLVYIGGHLSRLGHYYRHLYNCVRYVHEQDFSHEQKKSYIKMLRALLSNQEQICLFLNSLSPLGWVWGEPWDKVKSDGASLMMEYEMIKNIPMDALSQFRTAKGVIWEKSRSVEIEINPEWFYGMNYEHQREPESGDRPDFSDLSRVKGILVDEKVLGTSKTKDGKQKCHYCLMLLWGVAFLLGFGVVIGLSYNYKWNPWMATLNGCLLLLTFFLLGKLSDR